MKIILQFSLLFSIVWINQAQADWLVEDSSFVEAKTMENCIDTFQSEEVQSAPTSARRALNTDAETCVKKMMDRKLDEVLLPLKKSDPDAFKKMMASQKMFNQSVQKYCGRWESYYQKCCSTCSFNEETKCKTDLWIWRGLNTKPQFSKEVKLKGKGDTVFSENFTEFANSVCQDGNCSQWLLAELENHVFDSRPLKKCKK